MKDEHHWDITEFFKDGYFYRRQSDQWEYDLWGFYPNGIGDLIYNTLRVIIETGDKSKWAYFALLECWTLLREGKRWPDYMNDEPTDIYRSQFSMTRDPWILFYACTVHFSNKTMRASKPPWWLYSPKTWAWRRALLGKWNLYKFWKWISGTSNKQFVRDLQYFRDYAIKNK